MGPAAHAMTPEIVAEASALVLDGEVIWSNPPELGHFGIKLRKQIAEDEIIERMERRADVARVWGSQP